MTPNTELPRTITDAIDGLIDAEILLQYGKYDQYDSATSDIIKRIEGARDDIMDEVVTKVRNALRSTVNKDEQEYSYAIVKEWERQGVSAMDIAIRLETSVIAVLCILNKFLVEAKNDAA